MKGDCYLEILRAGMHDSIQDLGRYGYSHLGIPISGAMDRAALQSANALLGNESTSAAMEITLSGGKYRFHIPEDRVVSTAITGAEVEVKLNGIPTNYGLNQIKDSDILEVGRCKLGARAYLGISGGFLTKVVLGSRSFFKPITGKNKLVKGDKLIFKSHKHTKNQNALLKNNFQTDKIKVYKGPDYDKLHEKSKNELDRQGFTLSRKQNRMGIQIHEKLEEHDLSIASAPVFPGTVQLTPAGNMIVLMRDAQVTGGYPRILQLSESAINVLAQKKPNDLIWFAF